MVFPVNKIFTALAAVLLLTSFRAPATIVESPVLRPPCGPDLEVSTYRLGIGVLVETIDGELYLGTSPYAGSLHNLIVADMQKLNLSRILWMGELRYDVRDGEIKVREANETSGYFAKVLSKQGLEHDGRRIRVENSVENLPPSLRTKDFEGVAFGKGPERLPVELQGTTGDVRHTVGNSLQVILSAARISQDKSFPEARRLRALDAFTDVNRSDLILVRWLVLNLIQDERLKIEEATEVMKILNLLAVTHSNVAAFQELNLNVLGAQILHLQRFATPQHTDTTIDIYRIR